MTLNDAVRSFQQRTREMASLLSRQPTARQIIAACRTTPLSVPELSRVLNLKPGRCQRWVRMLRLVGCLEWSGRYQRYRGGFAKTWRAC